MYDDDDDESSDSSEECFGKTTNKDSSRKRGRHSGKKSKNDQLTWVEAAEIVLSKFDRPLSHKEILKHIEESNLKSVGRGSTTPLAVLNSMLNTHSRGPAAIFYRATPGNACFGLNKHRLEKRTSGSQITAPKVSTSNSTRTSSIDPVRSLKPECNKAKTYAEFEQENKIKQKLTPPTKYNPPVRQLKPPGQLAKYSPSGCIKQQLIPPGSRLDTHRCSPTLRTMSKATYERLKQQPQHRRMGPTTSALVKPGRPFSRPPPGAALRVMPPKKRVKLDDDDDDDDDDDADAKKSEKNKESNRNKSEDKSSRLPKAEETTRRESQRNQLRVQQQAKIALAQLAVSKQQQQAQHQKQIQQRKQRRERQLEQQRLIEKKQKQVNNKPHRPSLPRNSSRNSVNNKSTVPTAIKKMAPSSNVSTNDQNAEQVKTNSFLGVKFKRLKKANLADQIKRSKEGKLDLMSPDSILTSVHIKDLLNGSTFKLLPPAYQYQLLMLLPECDRQSGALDNGLRLSPHAMNNAFFTRACQEFKDKLMDGEFNSDIIQRAKHEVQLNTKLDKWKVKFFEPVYGQSNLDELVVNTEKEEPPPSKLRPVESSWVTFLKFAENSTDDFEEALAKIQSDVQKLAEKEAMEKEERERRKKLELSRLQNKSKKHSHLMSTMKISATVTSPLSLSSSKTVRGEAGAKEKSRRALKRAQLLQRKKAFDKQLRDAKAKIVEEARSGAARKDDENTLINHASNTNRDVIKINKKDISSTKDYIPRKNSTDITKTHPNTLTKEKDIKTDTLATAEKDGSVLDLLDSSTLKHLMKASEISKPIHKPAKRKQLTKGLSSRILYGPSTFGTNSEGSCPCNLKAMVACQQCGSFCHGDCVNGDQICVLCMT